MSYFIPHNPMNWVWWAMLLLAGYILFFDVGCAHRPSLYKQRTQCVTTKVKSNGGEIVEVFICSTFFNSNPQVPDGKMP